MKSRHLAVLRKVALGGVFLTGAWVLFGDVYAYVAAGQPVIPVMARYRTKTYSFVEGGKRLVEQKEGFAWRAADGSLLIRRWPVDASRPKGVGDGELMAANGEIYRLDYRTKHATLFQVKQLPLYRPRISLSHGVWASGVRCVELKKPGTTLYWSPKYDLYLKSIVDIGDAGEYVWEWYDVRIGAAPKPDEMRIPEGFAVDRSGWPQGKGAGSGD